MTTGVSDDERYALVKGARDLKIGVEDYLVIRLGALVIRIEKYDRWRTDCFDKAPPESRAFRYRHLMSDLRELETIIAMLREISIARYA